MSDIADNSPILGDGDYKEKRTMMISFLINRDYKVVIFE